MGDDGRIARPSSVDIEASEAIDGLRAEIGELRTDVRGVEARLRVEFREGWAENRRHAEVMFESLRDDIRIVAEGLVSLVAKVDAIRGPGGFV